MTPHELLLKAIKERQSKLTEFNGGILTADRYVKTISECVGSDLCYRFASKGQISFNDVLTKAAKTLTYNNEDMVLEDQYGKEFAWKDADGDELELPKNTLMVFKHVLTTPRKDRDGDIMRTQGAKPDPKMLLLWQHVHTLPIGKMLTVAEHNSKRLSVVSAIVDINELAHDSAVMIENKMGRFSHGFRALEFSKIKEGTSSKDGGFDIKLFEIMEESLVSVPSNPDSETEEVMLSLIEGGKTKSTIMKEIGKTLRQKQPKSAAVGVDVGSLKKEGDHGETKCSGKQDCGCGCSGSPKEADEDDGKASGTDDKKVDKCPKCGSPMVNGKCEKCDKEAEKSTLSGIKGNFELTEKMIAPYVDSGALEGSFEYFRRALDNQVVKYLTDAGVMEKPVDGKSNQWAYVIGTYPEFVVAAVYGDGAQKLYKIAWKSVDDGPTLSGKPTEVKVNMSTTIVEKMTSYTKSVMDRVLKSGRTVSASNMDKLKAAHEAVGEVHEKEMLMSKGGHALCKDAMSNIKAVMDAGALKQEVSTEAISKAMGLIVAHGTVEQRAKMAELLVTAHDLDEQEQITKEALALVKASPSN